MIFEFEGHFVISEKQQVCGHIDIPSVGLEPTWDCGKFRTNEFMIHNEDIFHQTICGHYL